MKGRRVTVWRPDWVGAPTKIVVWRPWWRRKLADSHASEREHNRYLLHAGLPAELDATVGR